MLIPVTRRPLTDYIENPTSVEHVQLQEILYQTI